jgi:hypothetical protein
VTAQLAANDAPLRKQQAIELREWVRKKPATEAVFVIGNFSFDYEVRNRRGNESYDELTREGVLQWVRPNELIDTQWSDADGDGTDDQPDTMQDGVFVAGAAKDWQPTCRVVTSPGDFPDDAKTSNHRPISLWLRMPLGR